MVRLVHRLDRIRNRLDHGRLAGLDFAYRRKLQRGPLDRGRQEGEAQGEATTARIQALPLEQLEHLAEALLDFSGPTDLAAWLEEHKG